MRSNLIRITSRLRSRSFVLFSPVRCSSMSITRSSGYNTRRYPSAEKFAQNVHPLSIEFMLQTSELPRDVDAMVMLVSPEFWQRGKAQQAQLGQGASDFLAKADSFEWVYTNGPRVLLVGLGDMADLGSVRAAAHLAVSQLKSKKLTRAAMFLDPACVQKFDDAAVDALVRVCVLSNHHFDKYLKTDNSSPALTHIQIMATAESQSKFFPVLLRAQVSAEATLLARELANDRPDEVNPTTLDSLAKDIASTHRLEYRSVTGSELQERQLNLISAVGQCAREPPRIVTLSYRGNVKNPKEVIAIVGKGITFDTGGLNLKMTGNIEDMHLDMSGAAAVLACIKAVEQMKLNVNVVAVLGLAENAIGSAAYKPLSIYSSRAGTVEVSNTDAEGRLVLADCLTFVQDEFKPSCIIDVATLTGACVVALGEYSAGLFTNSDALASGLQKAGDQVFERCWRMPILPEHTAEIENKDNGTYSDLKSTGKSKSGGACTAAAFLQKYIEPGVEWAHLDIAGPAMSSQQRKWICKGGTGFGAQLLIDYLHSVHNEQQTDP